MENILSPSLLAADHHILEALLVQIRQAGAKYVHVDVMDGQFVPARSFGVSQVAALRRVSDLIFDVHLMVREPDRYVAAFADAGADILTVHLEACADVSATLRDIRALGVRAGLSICPSTPVEAIVPHLGEFSQLLIMSVEPGLGGQKYLPASTQRIRQARRLLEKEGLSADLEVDGGVTFENVPKILGAGANMLVAGSAVFHGDVIENIRRFNLLLSC